MKKAFLAIMAAGAAAIAGAAPEPSLATPDISLVSRKAGNWTARYTLRQPVRQLLFARSPDKSRSLTWKTGSEFEIIGTDAGEVVRRRDGRAFKDVSFDVPPVYQQLPKDYAPFSPFGDGGMLFHSGRFFACAEACGQDPSWSFRLQVPSGTSILLNGQRLAGTARWIDDGSGRNVYVGDAQPLETAELLAVIDKALPDRIREPLARELPNFMRFFSERLGALPERPMLFASYDVAHPKGYGRQGGTLPGQVFTHFYGSIWPARMAEPGLADDLNWFFAHEAAHLYQRQLFGPESADAWIHEGGADALAAIALRSRGGAAAEAAERQIASKVQQCTKRLAGKSIRDAISAGDFEVAYVCGLAVNLHLDAAARKSAPKSDGLFSIWRHYVTTAAGRGSEPKFLAAVEAVAGAELAREAARLVRSAEFSPGRLVRPSR